MNLNYSIDFEPLYGLIGFLILIIATWKKISKAVWIDRVIILVVYVYYMFLFGILFFPIDLYLLNYAPPELELDRFVNVVPFGTIYEQLRWWRASQLIQLVGNVLLLMPLSICYLVHATRPLTVQRIVKTAFLVSLVIELLQLALSLSIKSPIRYCDVDDIILNVAGALIGYFIFRWLTPFIISPLQSNLLTRGNQ